MKKIRTLSCFFPSDNEYGDETSEGGAAFIILNPRNLNGHATIPAPPESTSHLSGELGHSKWSVNSTASVDGGRPASIDLEWENDGEFNPFTTVPCYFGPSYEKI